MSDQRTQALARSYAFGFAERWASEIEFAASGRADPRLVASVLAIETANRGRIARAVENAFARLLIRLRAERRFRRMSLGIAQLQPRRLELDFAWESVNLLNTERYAIQSLIDVIRDDCARCAIDPLSAERWRLPEWYEFGTAYNGSRMYGAVLEATYEHMRPVLNTQSPL